MDNGIELGVVNFTNKVENSAALRSTLEVRGWEDASAEGALPGTGKVYQTAPGSAGQLVMALVTQQGVKTVEQAKNAGVVSAGFSVSAIPVAVEAKLGGDPKKDNYISGAVRFYTDKADNVEKVQFIWGVAYNLTYISDSNSVQDLNKVMISENVKVQGAGYLKDVTNVANGYSPAYTVDAAGIAIPPIDRNFISSAGVSVDALKIELAKFGTILDKTTLRTDVRPGALGGMRKLIAAQGGTAAATQYFTFYDLRTGMIESQAANVTASGFAITYRFARNEAVIVQRHGFPNNGVQQGRISDKDSGAQTVPLE